MVKVLKFLPIIYSVLLPIVAGIAPNQSEAATGASSLSEPSSGASNISESHVDPLSMPVGETSAQSAPPSAPETSNVLKTSMLDKLVPSPSFLTDNMKSEDFIRVNRLAAEDIEALNLALTLEYLKLNFYEFYVSSGSFVNSYDEAKETEESNENSEEAKEDGTVNNVSSNGIDGQDDGAKSQPLRRRNEISENVPREDYNDLGEKRLNIREGIRRIREHSNNYINVMSKAIRMLGGNPLQKCSYQFQPQSLGLSPSDNLLIMARSFEAMSVAVYNGFQGIMSNGKLREIVSAMTAVQAAHLSFLNMHARQEAFTESFENVMSARQGLSFFKKYITSCPFAVHGGTFRTLNLRPEAGPIGSRILAGIMSVRNGIGLDNELIRSPSNPNGPIPTPIGVANFNYTNNYNDKSATGSEHCCFISGTRQVFSDYNRGCAVPNNLPTGIVFVHLVRERTRITATKIDHVLAGPAAFDILPQNGIYNPDFPINNEDIISNDEVSSGFN